MRSLSVVNELITETLYATSKLFSDTDMNFEQVVSRVATKGGITQEGIMVFDETLPQIFDEVFENTLTKRHMMVEKISTDFQII